MLLNLYKPERTMTQVVAQRSDSNTQAVSFSEGAWLLLLNGIQTLGSQERCSDTVFPSGVLGPRVHVVCGPELFNASKPKIKDN